MLIFLNNKTRSRNIKTLLSYNKAVPKVINKTEETLSESHLNLENKTDFKQQGQKKQPHNQI